MDSHDGGVNDTRNRILNAFLDVAWREGLERTTTRAVAEAAGVNEVTVFRYFGSKAALALEAVRATSPAPAIEAHRPVVRTDSWSAAQADLIRCVQFLDATLAAYRIAVRFGLGETRRYPELLAELSRGPKAAETFLRQALEQAKPYLRPSVDVDVVVLQWLGMLLVLDLLVERGVRAPSKPADRNRLWQHAVSLILLDAPPEPQPRRDVMPNGPATPSL